MGLESIAVQDFGPSAIINRRVVLHAAVVLAGREARGGTGRNAHAAHTHPNTLGLERHSAKLRTAAKPTHAR